MSQTSSESSDRASDLGTQIEEINDKISKLRNFDRVFEINSYCDDLESEVIVTIDGVIKQLKGIQRELIKEINTYRYELLDANKASQARLWPVISEIDVALAKQEANNLGKEFVALFESWSASLCQTMSDEDMNSLQADLNAYQSQVKALQKRMRKQAFNSRFLKFKQNQNFSISKDQIGKLHSAPEEMADVIGKLRNKAHVRFFIF